MLLHAVQRNPPMFFLLCPNIRALGACGHDRPSCNALAGDAATSDLLANGTAARACLTTLARLSHWRQPAGLASEGTLPLAAWAAAMHSSEDDIRCDF